MRRSVVITLISTGAIAGAGPTARAQARAAHPAPKIVHVHYVVAPTGNEARYRVREQLVSFDLPNDAVGVTKDITGKLVVDASGQIVRDSSRIVVGLTTLKSDKSRRDTYVHKNTLEIDKFPQVQLAPASFDGLGGPLAGAAPKPFSLLGDLTVHGVTHPTTWHVTAHTEGTDIVGSAATMFTFKDFGLQQPKVSILLSVEDTIKLEYDFRFARDATVP